MISASTSLVCKYLMISGGYSTVHINTPWYLAELQSARKYSRESGCTLSLWKYSMVSGSTSCLWKYYMVSGRTSLLWKYSLVIWQYFTFRKYSIVYGNTSFISKHCMITGRTSLVLKYSPVSANTSFIRKYTSVSGSTLLCKYSMVSGYFLVRNTSLSGGTGSSSTPPHLEIPHHGCKYFTVSL